MNIHQMLNKLEKDVSDTLHSDVAAAVKEEIRGAVTSTVYETYTPQHYSRRYDNNGLGDIRNIQIAEQSQDGICLIDAAPLDNGRTDYRLDEIVVNGYGRQPFPRDFYETAAGKLIRDKKHVEALKKGLTSKGYKVK